jgi:hypothetical protein
MASWATAQVSAGVDASLQSARVEPDEDLGNQKLPKVQIGEVFSVKSLMRQIYGWISLF